MNNPFDDDDDDLFGKNTEKSQEKNIEKIPANFDFKIIFDRSGKPNGLSKEQKIYIQQNWKTKELLEITRVIFKDETIDGRSKEGRLVKSYVEEEIGGKLKTAKREKAGDIELTIEQKEYILNHAELCKPYELARQVFGDEKLHQFSKQVLVVQDFLKKTKPELLKREDEIVSSDYSPPRTINSALKLISSVIGQQLEEKKINVKTKKCVERFIVFMNSTRFLKTINDITNADERDLFEREYIALTWDKPDLTSEELNLCISLCTEFIIQKQNRRQVQKLNHILELQSDTDENQQRIAMSLSDAIKGKNDEYNASVKRQEALTNDIAGKRSDRLKDKVNENKSIVAIMEAFRDEEERKNMIRLADIRKSQIRDELERLESFEEWEARIFGINKEDILDG